MKIVAIVPAAGIGKRLKGIKEKPFVKLSSKPLLTYALDALNKSPHIDRIILVVAKKLIKKSYNLVKRYNIKKVDSIIPGGKTRSDSVERGLRAVSKGDDYVFIHDGVRPFLDKALIEKCIKAVKRFSACSVCVPVKPTIKKAKSKFILKTLKRNLLWEAQTPQVFRRDIILRAYKNRRIGSATDDSSLVEKRGFKVAIVRGTYRNIKITTKEDLLLARALLNKE